MWKWKKWIEILWGKCYRVNDVDLYVFIGGLNYLKVFVMLGK